MPVTSPVPTAALSLVAAESLYTLPGNPSWQIGVTLLIKDSGMFTPANRQTAWPIGKPCSRLASGMMVTSHRGLTTTSP